MLQRIQSIFLLLAGTCAALPFILPAATTSGSANNSYLFSDSSFTLSDDSLLMVCFGLAALLWLADIFLFKNRIMQIRLSTISLLLIVVGSAYGAYLFSQDSGQAQAALSAGIASPVLAVIFGFLANRYIRSDERLVRSSDRLR